MARLHVQGLKADSAGLRSLGPHPVARGLPGVLRHKSLQLALGAVMLNRSSAGHSIKVCKLRPRVRAAHIDASDRLEPGSRRLDAEEVRGFTAFDTAPKLPLGCE